MLFSKGNKAVANQAKAQDPLVAVDIGTSKIRLIAGSVLETGEVEVSYFAETPSAGITNSSVSDLNKLADKLSTLIHEYEATTEKTFTHCVIGISGRHIESKNEDGTTTVPSRKVTEADRENAIEQARMSKFSEFKHIIHVIPQTYSIEGTTDISNPIGLSALRLGVGVHLIACNEDQESNLRTAFEMLSQQFTVDHVIYNGIAAADAVLTQEEKDIGVCLIDIGGGSINVSVYDQSKLVVTFGVEQGGLRITRDIATRYGMALSRAEFIKLKYGVAHPELLQDDEKDVILRLANGPDKEKDLLFIQRSDLATTVGLSLMDMLKLISDRLDRVRRSTNMSLTIGAGFVITGGVASTPGIATLAANVIAAGENTQRMKVKVGIPRGVISDNVAVTSPDCATAIGLLRFGHSLNQDQYRKSHVEQDRNKGNGVISKSYNWAKNWLSREF